MIRLIRPLIHIIVIGLIYRAAYYIRSTTGVFLNIDIGTPWVATNELFFYGIISALVFIITGIIHKRYDLIGIDMEKMNIFFTVWWQWTIIVTCLAYF